MCTSGTSDMSIQMSTERRWKYTDRAVLGDNRATVSTVSTTSFEWTDLGSNPVLRGDRPANNSVSHDRAFYSAAKRFKGVSCGVATDYPTGCPSLTLVDGGRTGQ